MDQIFISDRVLIHGFYIRGPFFGREDIDIFSQILGTVRKCAERDYVAGLQFIPSVNGVLDEEKLSGKLMSDVENFTVSSGAAVTVNEKIVAGAAFAMAAAQSRSVKVKNFFMSFDLIWLILPMKIYINNQRKLLMQIYV